MGKGKKLTYNEVVERINGFIEGTNFDIVNIDYTKIEDKGSKVCLRCTNCNSLVTFRFKSICNYRNHLVCRQCSRNKKIKHCIEEAKKYNKRSVFEAESFAEYTFLRRNGLLDNACSHMERGGNKYKRLIYSYSFDINGIKYIYVGLTYNMDVRDKAHHKAGSTVYKFCKEHNMAVPPYVIETDYMDNNEASQAEGEILQRYILEGYIPLNQIKTGGLGGNTKPYEYTIDELKAIASKYKNRSDWKQSRDKAYYFAERKHLLDDIIPKLNRHKLGRKPYYTYDKCKEIVNGYAEGTMLKEFYTNNMQCYSAIRKNGWNELLHNFIHLK